MLSDGTPNKIVLDGVQTYAVKDLCPATCYACGESPTEDLDDTTMETYFGTNYTCAGLSIVDDTTMVPDCTDARVAWMCPISCGELYPGDCTYVSKTNTAADLANDGSTFPC